jgi:hypothetical protein
MQGGRGTLLGNNTSGGKVMLLPMMFHFVGICIWAGLS